MIKVNLLRNSGGGGSGGTRAGTEVNYDTTFDVNTTLNTDSGSSSKRDMVVKIGVILATSILLYFYETYNIGQLRDRLQQTNLAKTNLSQELQQKKPMAAKARELQAQIQDIESRIRAIKDLSRVRLREIKSIDYLQNIIPEKMWFTQIDFDGNNVKIEGGVTSDDQLNRFLDDMESKSIFKNTVLLRAIEQKNKEGTVKIFTITSTVGNVD